MLLLELKEDLKKNYSPISKIICINYRMRNKISSIKIPIIKHILKVIGKISGVLVRIISQCEIPPDCIIGKGLRLEHGGNGIIIHHNAVIGENVKIFQQVTIGVNTGKNYKDGKCAIIGNNVLIGAGAKILGDVSIGNNAKIGTNAVVLNDIPDNCTAVGMPARIINAQ